MKIILGLFNIGIALVAFGHDAMAMDDKLLQSRIAQVESSWVVEEFTRENGFPTGECTMRANYDNNIEVTFKGKNGKLSALRIRDMNDAASSSIKGFLSLGLGKNSYGLQSRSVQGQIDGSLITVPAVAEKIMDLNSYSLRTGSKNYEFSSEGFPYAYHDLQKCTGHENAQTIKVVSDPRRSRPKPIVKTVDVQKLVAEPIDLVVQKELPNQVKNEDPLPLIDHTPKNIVPQPEKVIAKDNVRTWKAYKSDKLSIVLADWARQANVKPDIDLMDDITLDNDFEVYGSLDLAVGQLLEVVYGQNAPMAVLKNQQGDVTTITESSFVVDVTKNIQRSIPTENWRALQGMDLRKLLKRWSIRENVDFVWNADQVFLLKDTMKSVTDYKSAVAVVLEQFSDQDIKPVGSLNIDPETGKRTLIVSVLGKS